MKDMHSNSVAVVGVGNSARSADNTPAAIDLQGFNAADILLSVGIGGVTFDATDKIEVTVTHSADDVTYSNVTDDDMIGVTGITGGIIKTFNAAHAAAAVYKYGYRGGKRYLKVLLNYSGTHGTPTPFAVSVIKSHPIIAPAVA